MFDAETDGLLDDLTRLHCLVLRDLDSDTVVSCADQPGYVSIRGGLDILASAERVYGHNAIAFDLPAIRKVYPGFRLNGRLLDTMTAAAMRWAHIKDSDFARNRAKRLPGNLIGSHSLEAWGHRLGVLKGDYKKTNDFSQWSPEMQKYCEQDTAVGKALVERIRAAGVPEQAVETEHELAAYLFQQERNGWPFDMEKATALHASLAGKKAALEEELRTAFEPWVISLGMFTPKKDNKKRGYAAGVAIERFKTVTFNPSSTQHIADRLIKVYGWEPSQFTGTGLPVVDENTLKGLDYPPVAKLRECLLLTKRLGQIAEGKQAWLAHARKTGPEGGAITGLHHIHHKVWQNKAITARAAHSNPNLGQVPKVTSPYGGECRELFHVPEGWVQVGADASGLELRCLAHYMARYDNGAYGQSVIAEKPNDVHTLTATILGIIRDDAKTFIYALLYGAGDEKLGKIVTKGATPKEQTAKGAELRKKFFRGLPALKKVSEDVKAASKKHGFLRLIDGRRCYTRSEHAALNSLLQGTGAVICKRWIVEFNRRLTSKYGPQGWNGKWAALGWIHDEVQIAVCPEIAEDACSILVDSIRHMTSHFNFRVPLDGEAKCGANWKETH